MNNYFTFCLILLLIIFGSSCSTNRYGNVTNQNGEHCNKYHFQSPINSKEDKVLVDLVNIKNNKSVALIADYKDELSFYVTVFARPGQDLEARKLVLSMGWTSIKDVPQGLKAISRVLAN